MKGDRANNVGITMVETVMVIAIFAFIMIALAQLFLGFGNLFNMQESSIDSSVSLRRVAREMQWAVLQADRVVAARQFSGAPYASGSSTLIVELPAVSASGDIIAGSFDYMALAASGTQVYVLTEAAVGSARTSGTKTLSAMQSLLFAYDNADFSAVREVHMSATTTPASNATPQHVEVRAYLRNK